MNNCCASQPLLEEPDEAAPQAAPYLAALNAVSSAILIVDSNQRVLYANPAARLFAMMLNPAGVASGLKHARDWHPDLLSDGSLARGPVRSEWTVEARSGAGSGPGYVLLVEACALGPDRSGPYVLSIRDITHDQAREAELQARNAELEVACAKLKGAQEQIVQSERLASIGQLAAGVAHEINNPIGFVSSNLNTLQRYVANLLDAVREYAAAAGRTGAAAKAEIEEIRSRLDLDFLATDIPQLLTESCEGIERVSKIIRDLKDFSRRERSEDWVQADLHKGIDATLNIVWNELKYKAEVVKTFAELPPVECLPSELNQVFMNVLVNAAQAIKKNGLITISTGRENDNVWIAIGDNGEGIPADILPRVFDPFFTTKPVGTGTGLGLAISYGIIGKHHGNIQITSSPGEGTLLRIELPIKQPH